MVRHTPKLALVVVNKYWECDAVLAALLGEASPPLLRQSWPTIQAWPRPRANPAGGAPAPPGFAPRARAIYSIGHTTIECWCISDLLEDLPNDPDDQSSSERKAQRLPAILGGRAADLVIAVGTGASPTVSENLNGSVVAGCNVFAHNGDANNPASRWSWTFDTIVQSTVTPDAFRALTSVASQVSPRLLASPRNPGPQRALVASPELLALSDVNVTDYSKYAAADLATLQAFAATKSLLPTGSVETTHAVIRASLGSSFMFVTGMVNRFGRLDEDVGGSGFNSAQNFVGAYNAGVVLSWMLPIVDRVL